MSGQTQAAKPFNLRLPAWASEFVNLRAHESGVTKTQVVVDALSCLRAAEVQALMREGYEEMREADRLMAEEDMAVGSEGLPEW
jgi:hypothetical protein